MTTLPTPADAGLIVPGSIGAHAVAWIATLRASGRAASTVRSRTRELQELFAVSGLGREPRSQSITVV